MAYLVPLWPPNPTTWRSCSAVALGIAMQNGSCSSGCCPRSAPRPGACWARERTQTTPANKPRSTFFGVSARTAATHRSPRGLARSQFEPVCGRREPASANSRSSTRRPRSKPQKASDRPPQPMNGCLDPCERTWTRCPKPNVKRWCCGTRLDTPFLKSPSCSRPRSTPSSRDCWRPARRSANASARTKPPEASDNKGVTRD